MRNAAILALLCCFGLLSLLAAGENPYSAGGAEPIERLIERLGDRDPAVREKATQAIEAMGSSAAAALRRTADSSDPEVRRRVATLLASIEKAHLIAPKRITLKLEGKPIRDAVAEIAKQSGYIIELYPLLANPDEREKQLHTIKLDHVTFWEAIDRVCREGGLVLQRTWGGDDSKLQLRFSEDFVPFADQNGPFRLVGQGFQYLRNIEFSSVPRNAPVLGQRIEQLTFRFMVIAEPRMPMLWMGKPILTEAIDENNNSMVPPEIPGDNDRQAYHDRGHFHDAWINLARVGRDSQVVKRLRGVVPVRLLVEQSPELVVEKILQAKGQRMKSDNTDLEIEEVKENKDGGGKRYDVKFSVRNLRGDGGLDYNFYSSVRYRVELQDAKGTKYSWGGGGWGGNENSVRGTFTFNHPGGEAGPPARFVFYGWNTLYHRVPFEFRDLPLP